MNSSYTRYNNSNSGSGSSNGGSRGTVTPKHVIGGRISNSTSTNTNNSTYRYNYSNDKFTNVVNSIVTPIHLMLVNQTWYIKLQSMTSHIVVLLSRFSHSKLALLVQTIILLLLLQHTLNKFHRTDDSDTRLIQYRNNLCSPTSGLLLNNAQENQVSNYDVISTHMGFGENDLPSGIDRGSLCRRSGQFTKFVWVFVDSLARDQALDLISDYQKRGDTGGTNVYRILNHGFKFSTAIYTSFFTGKIPTNYLGHHIKSDNIFYQMKKAGLSINYVGPHFPTLGLLGDSPEAKMYFNQYTDLPNEDNILSTLFGDQGIIPTESSVASILDDLTDNGEKSLMLTSNLLDDKIHRTGKYDPPTLRLLKSLNTNIPLIRKWIDNHPEYVFIMNSDHGGSKTGGVHEGELHGVKDGGNEGFMMFHSASSSFRRMNVQSEMDQSVEPPWLDTVDISPTFSRYFKGVNIPLESLGKVAIGDNWAENAKSVYIDLLANAVQIRQLCILKRFPYSEEDFKEATEAGTSIIDDIDTNNDNAKLLEKIQLLNKFIVSIKEPMVDFKKFPGRYLFVIGILILVIQIINLKYEPFLMDDLKRYAIPTVLLFFYLYIDFLFLKFDYHKHYTNIFKYYLSLTAALILYLIHNITLEVQQQQYINSQGQNIMVNQQQQQQQQQQQYQLQQQQLPQQQTIDHSGFSEIDIVSNNTINNQDNQNNMNMESNDQPQQIQQQTTTMSNETLEWLNMVFNTVSLVTIAHVICNLIIEYLPMIYESFSSLAPLVNFGLACSMIYYIFRKRGQPTNTPLLSLMNGGSYLFILSLSFLYDMTHVAIIMQFGYFVLFINLLQLVLFNRLEDSYIVLSTMYYIVATNNQRFYFLVVLLPQLYFLSSVYSGPYMKYLSPQHGHNKWIARSLFFFIVMLTFNAYLTMGGQFNMNVDVRAGNVGLVNMEDYPTFSGFLMAYHKLGFFFILISILLRFSKTLEPCSELWTKDLSSIENNNNNESMEDVYETTNTSLKYWIFRYLGQKAIIMMWLFNLNFFQYKDYLDCFITTVIISIIVVGFGFVILLDDVCRTIQPKLSIYIIKLKQMK